MPARAVSATVHGDVIVRDLVRKMPAGRVVLDGVSATFLGGALTAVIGANGTGKSTLARVLAGVDRPDSGSVIRPGRATFFAPERVPALPACSLRNLAAGLAPALGSARGVWRPRLGAALDAIGFTHLPDTPLQRLSKGNVQKAYVALAYALQPSFALLDEPTTGLDPLSRTAAGELLRAVAADGGAVVVTAHERVGFADAQLRLADGHLTVLDPVSVERYVVDLALSADSWTFWDGAHAGPSYTVLARSTSQNVLRLLVDAATLPVVLRAALDQGDAVTRVVPE